MPVEAESRLPKPPCEASLCLGDWRSWLEILHLPADAPHRNLARHLVRASFAQFLNAVLTVLQWRSALNSNDLSRSWYSKDLAWL